jgi:hypothetical protein
VFISKKKYKMEFAKLIILLLVAICGGVLSVPVSPSLSTSDVVLADHEVPVPVTADSKLNVRAAEAGDLDTAETFIGVGLGYGLGGYGYPGYYGGYGGGYPYGGGYGGYYGYPRYWG